MLRMEVKALVLLLQLNPINLHLPRLIVQLITFGEALSGQNAPEACYRPNVLRLLNDGIGSELMYLHLKFQQDVGKHMVWVHP
jgi:hypothetical protein